MVCRSRYLHDAGYYINWFGKDDALGPNAFKYIDYWCGQRHSPLVVLFHSRC